MNDRESLIRAVYLNPRCMVARSVLADFLEGIGEADEAAAYLERRRVWPARWAIGDDEWWAWLSRWASFRNDYDLAARVAEPVSVWRHLRASRHENPYAVQKLYTSEDDALDALSEAAHKAFGLVARPA